MGKLKVRISLPRNEQSYGTKMMFDDAVRFYAKEIMGSRLANLCTIKVHIRKYVSRRKGANVGGYVAMNPTGSKRQRKFEIVLNDKRDLHEKLQTLAHEMIHVKQKAKDEAQWRYDRKTDTLYVRWKDNAPVKHDEIPYRERPWEVEAYALQDKYYNAYLQKLSKEKAIKERLRKEETCQTQ